MTHGYRRSSWLHIPNAAIYDCYGDYKMLETYNGLGMLSDYRYVYPKQRVWVDLWSGKREFTWEIGYER